MSAWSRHIACRVKTAGSTLSSPSLTSRLVPFSDKRAVASDRGTRSQEHLSIELSIVDLSKRDPLLPFGVGDHDHLAEALAFL